MSILEYGVGNLISNVVVVVVSLSASLHVAFGSLIYLVAISAGRLCPLAGRGCSSNA